MIEAVQLKWETWNEMCEFAGVGKLSDNKPEGCFLDAANQPIPAPHGGSGPDGGRIGLQIPTLEGLLTAQEDDWVIKGVKGELYPCKPDIFAQTYEKA